MQITKHETVDVEVTVDVSISDVVSELPVTAENVQQVLRGFSTLISFVRALPDELVTALNPKQREIISACLVETNNRLTSLPLPSEVSV